MGPTQFFIKRPTATTLLMLGILVFGVLSYRQLPVSYLPAVDFPTIEVSAYLPGASAETMASNVATPLEEAFSDISGIASMSSVSRQSATKVTLTFDLERDVDLAAMDVQAAITQASGDLPDLPSPPSYSKVNPTEQPILWLVITSDEMPLTQVNNYVKTFMVDTLGTVEGVAQVVQYGLAEYAVRVQVDPGKLAAMGLGMGEVKDAIEGANVNLPLGQIQGPTRAPVLKADGQLTTAEPYNRVILAYRDGQPVYLESVGRAIDSQKTLTVRSTADETPALILAIKRANGSNTIDVVDRVRAMLPKIRDEMPGSVDVEVFYDRSISVKDSVDDVETTLAVAIGLVVLVVFAFLRSLRGTLIAGLAIPFSIIATFAVMERLDFTLDILSLMALTLAIGFVVDDAIVMLENIVRHLGMGKTPLRAATEGAAEIGFTILSMTLSLVVVFIPLLFMAGMIGRILHEFAMTISAAIIVSGLVSLSLTPMLCARLLKGGAHLAEEGPLVGAMLGFYRSTLGAALRAKPLVLILAAVMLYLTVHLFQGIPKGFEPEDDQANLWGVTIAMPGTSIDQMAAMQADLAPILKGVPEVKSHLSIMGYPSQNQGLLVLTLTPASQRKRSAEELVHVLMERLNAAPGLLVFLQNPPMIPTGGQQSNSAYQYILSSAKPEELYEASKALKAKMEGLKEITGVSSDLMDGTPQVGIRIDRERAAALDLSAAEIENALWSAYGTREVSTIYATTDQYKVILEVAPEHRLYPEQLKQLYINDEETGALIRLDAVAEIEESSGLLQVAHFGQLTSVTLSFNTAPGVSLGAATAAVEGLAKEHLPTSVTGQFAGSAQQFQKTMVSLTALIGLCVLVIYLILGMLYEHPLHPLTIISGLPSAALGGLLTLTLFGRQLDIFGFVGLIMLIGIVLKNAIMVVNFALEEQARGRSADEAVYQGALVRFRPIMMTTFAAIMGALPIALGIGAGAQARQPLGLAVVGGLLLSQVVTLYLTPVMYCYIDDIGQLFGLHPGLDATPDGTPPAGGKSLDQSNGSQGSPEGAAEHSTPMSDSLGSGGDQEK